MRRRRPMGWLFVGSALLLASAACGESAAGGGSGGSPAGSSGASPGSTATVSVTRSGGFAGVGDRVEIAADGTWTATDRDGARRTGQLSGRQRTELAELARDPGLAAEATQTRPPTRCADAFTYEVTVGGTRVSFVDCPTDPEPPRVAAGIVGLVRQAVFTAP